MRCAPISRAEISRRVGISKPTVSVALESLLEAGLVREASNDREGPKYGATFFEPVPEAALVLGLDLGARFLRDMARRDPRYVTAIQRTLTEVAPVADGVLKPHWMEGGDDEQTLFGVSVAETRAFAMKALERRMKVIGLLQAA